MQMKRGERRKKLSLNIYGQLIKVDVSVCSHTDAIRYKNGRNYDKNEKINIAKICMCINVRSGGAVVIAAVAVVIAPAMAYFVSMRFFSTSCNTCKSAVDVGKALIFS